MKKLKALLCSFFAVALTVAGTTLTACTKQVGQSGKESVSSSEAVRQKPEITVAEERLDAVVGKSVTLPAARATDAEQGDISSLIKMNVYFDRDMNYAYPLENPRNGTDGSVEHTFTPKKVGEYIVAYTVMNDAGLKTTKEIPLTVAESGEECAQQLVADRESWVLSDGAGFNAEGALELLPGASVAYGGQKLKNGDYVQFSFNADRPDGTWFYFLNAHLSKSRAADAPTESEGIFPEFLNIRILGTYMEVYLINATGLDTWSLGNINVSVLDGKDHTMALRSTVAEAGEDKALTFEIWVDADIEESPKMTSTVMKSELIEKYGQATFDERLSELFDESALNGFFNMGTYKQSDSTADRMCIKSLAINGEQATAVPELKAEQAPAEYYIAGEEITFANASAEDSNNYSDITSRVKLSVIGPIKAGEEAEVTPLEGYRYTPEEFGVYKVVYSVTDYSGNKAFLYYDFKVAQGENDELPTIVLSGSTEEIRVQAGEKFTLPAVESVKDAFENDLSEYLEIELLGGESKSLLGATECTLWVAGEHTIEYRVVDYNGNERVLEIPVTVGSVYEDSLYIDEDNFKLYSGAKIADGQLNISKGDANAAFKGQKIYGEKVRVLLDVDIATAYGAGDGINFVVISLRGGKNLNTVPGASDCGNFAWPNGLNIEINASDGLAVWGAAHAADFGKYQFTQGTRAAFSGEVELAWQVTDEYNEKGVYQGTRLFIWLNGEQLKYTGQSDGSVFIPARRALAECPTIQQGTWLAFYTNGAAVNPSYIKAITIDGSKPEKRTVTIPEGEAEKTVDFGSEYIFPAVTATYGEQPYVLKRYILVNGEDALRETEGEAIDVTGDLVNGFKVLYYNEDGKLMATLNVVVNAEVAEVTFDSSTEDVTAGFGKVFAYPKVTGIQIGETEVTDGFTVVKSYPDSKILPETVTGDFKVLLGRDFVLTYYYGTIRLAEISVSVTDIPTGEITDLENATGSDSDYFCYENRTIYGEKVSVVLDMAVTDSTNDIILRGLEVGNMSWPTALRLRFNNGEIKVTTNIEGGDILLCTRNTAEYFGDASEARERVFAYRATDQYDNTGRFLGIFVEIWIDGKEVVWQPGIAACSDGLIKASVLEDKDESLLYTPAYIHVITRNVYAHTVIKKVVIDETISVDPPERLENLWLDETKVTGANVNSTAAWAKYTGQKIYDEKVTVVLTMGMNAQFYIALRGVTEDKPAPGGLVLFINGNHIILTKDSTNPYGAGNIFAFVNTADYFSDYTTTAKEVVIAYQCTDVLDSEGNVAKIRFWLSIDGKEWTYTFNAEEAYLEESSVLFGTTYAPEGTSMIASVKELYIEGISEEPEEPEQPEQPIDPDEPTLENLWLDETSVTGANVNSTAAWAKYTGQKIYDEKTTVVLTMGMNAQFYIALRGVTEDKPDPSGLVLFINGNHIILTKDCTNPYGAGNIYAFVNTADYISDYTTAAKTVTIIYQCTDILDSEGNVTKIRFWMSIDGKEWTYTIDAEEAYLKESSVLFGTTYAPEGTSMITSVKELYIEGKTADPGAEE